MTDISSSLSKADDGTSLIQRDSLQLAVGFRKQLTRAEFNAAVAAERVRIAQNSAGIYPPGEEFAILGEVGYRTWFLATGGSDAANAAVSHARTVNFGSGMSMVLASDSNVAVSGQPTTGVGSANGDVGVVWGTGIFVRTGGDWPSTPAVSLATTGTASSFTSTPFAAAIPLDLTAGRDMGVKYLRDVGAPVTLSVATSPAAVTNGNCNLTLVADGANAVTLAAGAFGNAADFTFSNVAGQVHEITVVQRPLGALIFCQLGAVVSGGSAAVAPAITAQPASQSVTAPATATFTIAASGTPAPTYQWRKTPSGGSAANISGATSASYTTPATSTADSGSTYSCVVLNSAGSATSNAATLTVAAAAPAPSPAPSPSPSPAPAPALTVLMEDSYTDQTSSKSDVSEMDRRVPDVSNAEGGRWSDSAVDNVYGNIGRISHWFADRSIYPVASARPKKIEHTLSFPSSMESGVTFRDAGDRSTSTFYFVSMKVDSVTLFKLDGGAATQLWTAATTAFGGGASGALTILDDASGNCTILVNGIAVGTPVVLDSFATAKGISIGASYSSAAWTRTKVSA